MEHKELVSDQFGAAAQDYLASPSHALGADLGRLVELVRGARHLAALDLGCGAGHAGFALARGGAQVTCYDLSPEMLAVVGAEARRQGFAGLRTVQGPAETLPFPDAAFDLVVTRFSAHHWADVPAALGEARRVLKAGGSLVVIDVVASESPLFDTFLQTVELLRDPSHVRDYRVSDWRGMLEAAGFLTPSSDAWTLPMEFQSWTARARTPEVRCGAIRDVFEAAPDSVRRYFQVAADGSFRIDVAWLQTRSPD